MSNNINSEAKDRFPTESGFKVTLMCTFVAGIAGIVYSIHQSFYAFHHGDKLNQKAVDDLIDRLRALDFVYVPTVSIWLIYISIYIWKHHKKHAGKT